MISSMMLIGGLDGCLVNFALSPVNSRMSKNRLIAGTELKEAIQIEKDLWQTVLWSTIL